MNNENEEQAKKPVPSQYNITISVLNSNENWIELPDFKMTVSEALDFMLQKLQLKGNTDEKVKLKYFLLRRSERTADGFDILAEFDKYGDPVTLEEYGIANGVKLDIGAIVLPDGKSDIKLQGNENITFFNDEDVIYEL